MANFTVKDMLKAIRDNSSAIYQDIVPDYDESNLVQVGDSILKSENAKNEFLNALVKKIATTEVVNNPRFVSPFNVFEGAERPFGGHIEEIFVNPSLDTGFDNDPNLLLKTTKPDTKTAYYGLNRKGKVAITISDIQLRDAFKSEQALMSLLSAISTSMYSGDEISRFNLVKRMLAKNIDAGNIKVIECDIDESPKDVAKKISQYSKNFKYPSFDYNGYNLVNKDKFLPTDRKCQTWCPETQQVIIKPAITEVELSYEVIASQFQKVADIPAKSVEVDVIPSVDYDVYAILCDERALQIHNFFNETRSFENGAALETNYWYHHWEYFYLSLFSNCVVFARKRTEEEKTRMAKALAELDAEAEVEQKA